MSWPAPDPATAVPHCIRYKCTDPRYYDGYCRAHFLQQHADLDDLGYLLGRGPRWGQ